MTLEFNIDDHNNMLIAFTSGEYDYEKLIKVIKMTLEKCLEKNLKRALIDMAQITKMDVTSIQEFIFTREMFSSWGNKVKLCIVYDHKFIPDIKEVAQEGPEGWVLVTANKNQSVFWLLAS